MIKSYIACCTLVVLFVFVTGCLPIKTPVMITTPTKTIMITPSSGQEKISPTPIKTNIPKPTESMLQIDQGLLNSLETGEYLVILDQLKNNQEYVLSVFTPEGDMIGELAHGNNFSYASISPDHKWIAFIENSRMNVWNIETNERYELTNGCKQPSWSPDSLLLIASCGSILAFGLEDGQWNKVGEIPMPDFGDMPVDISKYINSPVISPNGEYLAFYVDIPGIVQGTTTGYGPYIIPVSCFIDKGKCEIHMLGVPLNGDSALYWLPGSGRIAIFPVNEMQVEDYSNMHLFDAKSGKQVGKISIENNDSVESLVITPDNKKIAYKTHGGSFFTYDTNSKNVLKIYQGENYDQSQVMFWLNISNDFTKGNNVKVAVDGNGVNLRESPSPQSNSIKLLPPGTFLKIVGGPVPNNNYEWWQVELTDGTTGWVVEVPAWYEKISE